MRISRTRKLTHRKTDKRTVRKALESLVRAEERKGILRYYGSGIWKGDLRAMRKNHA